MKIKDQIAQRMQELGISVAELEHRLEVSNQTIRYWLAGRNHPRPKARQPLEEALSCRFDWSERGTFTPIDDALRHMVHTRPAAAPPVLRQQDDPRADIENFMRFQRLPYAIKDAVMHLVEALETQLYPDDERPSVIRTYTKRR